MKVCIRGEWGCFTITAIRGPEVELNTGEVVGEEDIEAALEG